MYEFTVKGREVYVQYEGETFFLGYWEGDVDAWMEGKMAFIHAEAELTGTAVLVLLRHLYRSCPR